MTERFVDPNTDNLDDFSALFHGEAKELTDEVKDATPESAEDEDAPITPEGETDDEDDTLVETVDEDDTEAEDDGDDDAPEPQAKKKSRFQERIDELTQQRREADARAKALEAKVDELLKSKEKEAAPEPKSNEAAGPTPDDVNPDGSEKYPLGEFDPLYIRDLTRFTISQETARAKEEATKEAEARQMEAAQAELTSQWAVKLEKAKDQYPDMLEKNQALVDTFTDLDPAYGEYLAQTIMSMDYGPDVLYYLANNVAEAQRIASSGPTKATIALGRLEAKFADVAAEKQLRKPKVSKAPEPAPVNKGSAVNKTVPADTDDLEAFSAMFFAKK